MPKPLLNPTWQTLLADYVTALAWSPDGSRLAACSAAGEVVVFDAKTGASMALQAKQGLSVDAIAFSADGTFLAAAGQAGTVSIWRLKSNSAELLSQLENPRVWVDCLRWHPRSPELAFSLGRYAQVWDAVDQSVVATPAYEASSVLDLAWHPSGDYLTLAGNLSVKTWRRDDWYDDPEIRETGGASGAIAISPDGQYLASGNNDRTLLVWEWHNPYPWQMQGFPGKVRSLAWSTVKAQGGAPLLASASAEGVVVWAMAESDTQGWTSHVLDLHSGAVRAVAFQPQSTLLASASEDGWVCLWQKATEAAQILEGAADGFSALAWSPQGKYLAAGGCGGELLVWAKALAGKGFGR
ncbi:WD40 repeat domain-containing protein [Nodosilinea sp. LEGE 07298]|uniref:WD40 repeat domain-containing protein n=1 Tax=Nodosilinea sp. LEGE 07298 TaxID=2777970 RepID=UPI00187F5418|nr:WD40 repeat domain-containing protein [Nodosilinea sp. LEGE 07298]MBE9113259.1 WD40 repeat domain-containing protein [Nodosilinea sp. LEGE 07298]